MNHEAKLYIQANKKLIVSKSLYFSNYPLYILIGSINELENFLSFNKDKIEKYYMEKYFQHSLFPLFDISKTKARIEPGAIIRDDVFIHDDAVILMGAVINRMVSIGSKTMIDMNAVVGSGASIGANCHIGACAVIAGIMEPKSDVGVIIEDNVFIGAGAVVLEGVHIEEGAIIGAGAVVLDDVSSRTTVVGVPAKSVNKEGVWELNDELRKRL